MNAQVIVLAECCSKGQREGQDLAAAVYRGGQYTRVPLTVRHLHGREVDQLGLGIPVPCRAEQIRVEPWVVLVQDGAVRAAPASQWRTLV